MKFKTCFGVLCFLFWICLEIDAWVLEFESWVLEFGSWVLKFGSWVLGLEILIPGNKFFTPPYPATYIGASMAYLC